MITVDTLLIELFQQGIEKLNSQISIKDKRILTSLSRQITAGQFLTENQSKLLVKILKENQQHLTILNHEKLLAIECPTWSQQFRVLDQVRRIFIGKEHDGRILVEFTYNKRLRQLITDLNKQLDGQVISNNSKQYIILLTEKNIYTLVNAFKNQGFEIDPILTKFHGEIVEIMKTKTDQFDIFSLTNEKLISSIEGEVNDISVNNLTLLNDRSLRFQYSIFPKNPEISLKNSLANRASARVWIDSSTTTFDNLIASLQALDRLPVMVVFNGHDSKECLQNLKKLENSLKNNNINSGVGIYFRFDNGTDYNKEFNATISNFAYNAKLDSTTQVAGIANNKLPKFMIKNGWYPKSVISFSNNFKGNKTSVYCDAVDLIVYYNDKRPLGGADAIV